MANSVARESEKEWAMKTAENSLAYPNTINLVSAALLEAMAHEASLYVGLEERAAKLRRMAQEVRDGK